MHTAIIMYGLCIHCTTYVHVADMITVILPQVATLKTIVIIAIIALTAFHLPFISLHAVAFHQVTIPLPFNVWASERQYLLCLTCMLLCISQNVLIDKYHRSTKLYRKI